MNALKEAISFFEKEEYARAISALSGKSDELSDSENMEAAYYLGLSYAKLGRNEEALLFLEQIVTSSGDKDRVRQCRLLLAVLYTKTGRHRLADFELQKLMDSGDCGADILCAKAYSAWAQKKGGEATALYENALALDPKNPTALNGLGYVLASQGKDISRAFTLIKQALQISPNSPACLDSLGWAYFKMGLSHEARQAVKKARALLPENPEIESHYNEIQKILAQNRENDRTQRMGESR